MADSAITFSIEPKFVGKIIGAGGKTIRRLRYTFHSDIKISNEGAVDISNGEDEAMKKAQVYILSMCKDGPGAAPPAASASEVVPSVASPSSEASPVAGVPHAK